MIGGWRFVPLRVVVLAISINHLFNTANTLEIRLVL
jgi:hypothetical protein